MDRNETQHRAPPDEIDIAQFVRALWKDKWRIILIAGAATCMAAAYAFLASPVYQATARMLPPTASGLASYNAASQLTGSAISGMLDVATPDGITAITPSQAYSIFLTQLTSDTIKQRFFDEYYKPALSSDSAASDQQLWQRLGRATTIERPKQGENASALTLQGHDPKLTAEWANSYVELAIESTRTELLENLKGEIQVRVTGVEDQLSTLRSVAKLNRDAQIKRLQSALAIAESLHLEEPMQGGALVSIDNRQGRTESVVNGELMYLRGAKALRSELSLLKARDNDDAYISALPDLLKKRDLLKKIDLQPSHLSVVRVDAKAQVPEEPVRPRKLLILLVGIVVGGFLGFCVSLVRLIFSKKPS